MVYYVIKHAIHFTIVGNARILPYGPAFANGSVRNVKHDVDLKLFNWLVNRLDGNSVPLENMD